MKMRKSGWPVSAALRAAIALPLLALSMTACGTSTEKPVIVTRSAPVTLVLPCPRQPPRPAEFADEVDRYAWVLKAIHAGAVCRTAHDKLAKWAVEPPA